MLDKNQDKGSGIRRTAYLRQRRHPWRVGRDISRSRLAIRWHATGLRLPVSAISSRVLDAANRTFALDAHGRRLSDLIYPHPTFNDDDAQHNAMLLQSTQVAQPAIGAVSLGLLKVLEHLASNRTPSRAICLRRISVAHARRAYWMGKPFSRCPNCAAI